MSALSRATLSPMRTTNVPSSAIGIGLLRGLLLVEAVLGLVLAIGLSMLASSLAAAATDGGTSAEQTVRFAAGFALLFGILAAFASRGVRRRRSSAWTLAALLQLILAVATGVAAMTTAWHPALLLGFVLPAVVMLALSAASVRRALGQA